MSIRLVPRRYRLAAIAAALGLAGAASAGGPRTTVVVGVPVVGAPVIVAPAFPVPVVAPAVSVPIYPAAPNLATTFIRPPVAPVFYSPAVPGLLAAPPGLFPPIGVVGAPLVGPMPPVIAPSAPVFYAPVFYAPPVQAVPPPFGPQIIIIRGSGWH